MTGSTEQTDSGEKAAPVPDALQAAAAHGIDISMLIDNLHRTPAERIRRHQIALDTVEILRKADRV